jgi:triphosphoribosyl-dephospho-CoA synthetase
MLKLEEETMRLYVSPGGSADLLAATIFVDAVAEDSDGTI